MNTYAYVENNPLSYVDPWGLILQYADPASDTAMRPSVLQMMTTPKGRELLKKLNDDPQTYLIHSGFGPHGTNYQLGQDVYVDPNANINIPATDSGTRKFSTTRILAHELGHCTGTLDDGPNNMNNVNKWENSIMFPIEGYNRTRY